MRRLKLGSKTEKRERRQMAKWKTMPTAGARHVPLHSSDPHHPDTKNNGSQEKGRGASGQEDLQRWHQKQWAATENNSMGQNQGNQRKLHRRINYGDRKPNLEPEYEVTQAKR